MALLEQTRRTRIFLPLVARLTVAIFAFVTYSPGALAVVQVAQAAGHDAPAPTSARQALAMTLQELKELTVRDDPDPAAAAATTREASRADVQPLLDLRVAIVSLHEAAGEEFAAERARIVAADLPPVVLDRHDAARARYEDGLAQLLALLEQLDAAATRSARWDAFVAVREYLAQFSFATRHQKLDPEKLPRRAPKPTEREPRTRKDQFSGSTPPPVHLAFNGELSPLLLAQGPSPELEPTLDAPFTAGITDLAASLDNNAARIFDWVRTKVRFVPTNGSIQGAEGCRLSRECNAYDTASLLIALLRVSGTPARYVVGTVEVDPVLFMSAMGDFDDLTAAGNLAASGGIPVTTINGPEGPEAVRMEHVWVEAMVDYVPSRGAVSGAGDTWVPLEACLKRNEYRPPMNVEAAIGVDFDAYVNTLMATGTASGDELSATGFDQALASSELENMAGDLNTAILATMPGATVADVVGAVTVKAEPLDALPASLPVQIVVAGERKAVLTDSERHRVTLQVATAPTTFNPFEQVHFTISWFLPELANRRVTIGYIPATAADVATVEASGGLWDAPLSSVNVRPVVFLDGEAVANGPGVGMGIDQTIRVTFFEPGAGSDAVSHTVPAGTYALLGLDPQRVSTAALAETQARFDATRQALDWGTDPDNLPDATVAWDDVMGGMLHLHAQTYFLEVEVNNEVAENASNVVSIKRPAEMLATYRPQIVFGLFGAPVDISHLGMAVDVQRYIVSTVSRAGDAQAERDYNVITGAFGSVMEHKIFESLQRDNSDPLDDLQAVSTVKLLAEANRLNMPIYRVTPDNLAAVLPQLTVPSSVRSDVAASVNAGKEVLIHRDPITVQQWTGVGYLVLSPDGTGAWLISGGLAGGATGKNSTWGEWLSDMTAWLTYAANPAGLLLPLLQASSKFFTGAGAVQNLGTLSKWVGRAGIVIAVLSAILTFWGVFTDPNGGFWEGLLAGGADALGSLLIYLLVAKLVAVIGAGAGILALFGWVVLIIALTALILYLVKKLVEWLLSASWSPPQRRRMLAQGPPRIHGLLGWIWPLLAPEPEPEPAPPLGAWQVA